MTNKQSLQPLFILHARSYRDTSFLLDCFTESQGRISLIARGAKRPKSPFKNLLQPFIPLLASWQGKSDLCLLTEAELIESYPLISGEKLWRALYLNELLMRVLHKHDPYVHIFHLYAETLKSNLDETILRSFEKKLLIELGYGFSLHLEQDERALDPEKYYFFHSDYGYKELPRNSETNLKNADHVFLGKHLLAIAQDDYADATALKDAKRLMRLAFQPLLGDRPLKTRELFIKG